MSLRKAKQLLQHKKLQQQQLLNKQQQQIQQEDEPEVIRPVRNNIFAAFEQDDDDQQQKQKQENQSKSDNLKKTDKPNTNSQKPKNKKNKAKKKKNQQNKDKHQQQNVQKQQDIQKAFKQIGLQYNKTKNEDQNQTSAWSKILQINENKFNYQKQLRRHFGSAGNTGQQKKQQPDLNKKQQRMQKHLKKAMKKSVLSPGVKDVFIIRQKFEIDRNQQKIKFIPTKKYDQYQAQYEAVRNSNDINALFMFMQTHPQHVDSIYAVGEFLRLQGNYREADNLIQRAIYIYEMSGGYDLNEFIKEDLLKKQIIYDTYTVSLFMSLFKFMDILGKKGCFRAALQYNKFLLKINLNDPTACILCFDFNSISAKSYEYLIEFIEGFGPYLGQQKTSLYMLPNFIYSVALAKYYIQNNQKTQKLTVVQQNNPQLLKFNEQDWKAALIMPNDTKFVKQNAKILILRALLVYPKLIYEIAMKNQYAKQFLNLQSFVGNQKKTYKQIFTHDFWSIIPTSYSYNFLRLESVADSAGLDKILQVYVERSKILWKSNQIMLWVKGAIGFLLNKIDNKQFDYQAHLQKLCIEQGGGIPIPFLLRRYANISKSNFSDRVQRIDLANIQDNQRQRAPQQQQNRMSLQGNPLTMFLNSLLPWVNLPSSQSNQDPDMPDIQQDD